MLPPTPDSTGNQWRLDGWWVCGGGATAPVVVKLEMMVDTLDMLDQIPCTDADQVAASTHKEVDAHIPNYPSLPPQLVCQLHNVTMHADVETDEVYAQMTLQPLSPQEQKDASFLPADLGIPSKQPTNYFCKTLTASDTSTHGGFSVPRRAAEKVFPPLYQLHMFCGKAHVLLAQLAAFKPFCTLFIRNEKNQLLLGIRRANRPQTVMPSSVLSSDSMHLGLLAAAAHAAATNSRFTIFYNPRASPSEFVIPLTKFVKAVYHTRISIGMRFRMLFETEESSVRRYMGTITGISDLDPVRWSNSHWRSVKVGWDESTAGERQPRVSLWEIEPLTTFPMYPSPFPFRVKRPWPPGLPSFNGIKEDDLGMNSLLMWLHGDNGDHNMSLNFQGIGPTPWMQPRIDASMLGMQQSNIYQAMAAAAALQDMRTADPSKQALLPSVLQFQQPQNVPGRSAGLMQPQMLHQSQPQSFFLPSVQDNQSHHQTRSQSESQSQTQSQSHLLQEQLQHQHSFTNQHCHQQQQLDNHQQVSTLPAMSQFVSSSQALSPSLQAFSSMCQQQSFSDSTGNPVSNTNIVSPIHSLMSPFSQAEASHILNLPRSDALLSSSGWPPKRVAIDPLMPQVEQLGPLHENTSQNGIISLPPFPGRECSIDQEGSNDTQNHLLFGVNIDSSSLLIQNGVSSIRRVGSDTDSTSVPFACSNNYLSTTGTRGADFSLNPVMTPSSCLDETGFLQSPENLGQANSPTRTFVKVYKSGSYGRSLDISKFSSYHELRSELARMFGLEGQLEDPLRSGWQLVFVDRENDVLLLGDDPWQEFVNSVWCIQILSPQEMHHMGKPSLGLLNSIPIQRLSNSSSCDDYTSRQESRSLSTGIASVGSLDY
ncbi:hypothetical protein U1Q18_009672 [Sarracenia purpurea var. burkii]